jgi:hypothetical protein
VAPDSRPHLVANMPCEGRKRCRSGAWSLVVFTGWDPSTGKRRNLYEKVRRPDNGVSAHRDARRLVSSCAPKLCAADACCRARAGRRRGMGAASPAPCAAARRPARTDCAAPSTVSPINTLASNRVLIAEAQSIVRACLRRSTATARSATAPSRGGLWRRLGGEASTRARQAYRRVEKLIIDASARENHRAAS